MLQDIQEHTSDRHPNGHPPCQGQQGWALGPTPAPSPMPCRPLSPRVPVPAAPCCKSPCGPPSDPPPPAPQALSQLEIGELCVAAFGKDLNIIHPLSDPFSTESGATVLSEFTWQQKETNIRTMLGQSLDYLDGERGRSAPLTPTTHTHCTESPIASSRPSAPPTRTHPLCPARGQSATTKAPPGRCVFFAHQRSLAAGCALGGMVLILWRPHPTTPRMGTKCGCPSARCMHNAMSFPSHP